MYHYVYMTTHPSGEFYIGMRSSFKRPRKDPYLGSGIWVMGHPEKEKLKKRILEVFEHREHAAIAERQWLAVCLENPLCQNRNLVTTGISLGPCMLKSFLAGK